MWTTSENEVAEQTLTERAPIIAAADLVHVDILHRDKNEMYELKEKVLEMVPAAKRVGGKQSQRK